MASLRLISLAGAALVFGHGALGDPEVPTTSTSVNCLDAMNEMRNLVGYAPFKQESDPDLLLPTTESKGLDSEEVKAMCDGIVQAGNPRAVSFKPEQEGYTYAFAVQEGEKADCKAAVDYWSTGCRHLLEFPPPYISDATMPYASSLFRSFVGLFNPKPDPTVDCAYFVCPYNNKDVPKPEFMPITPGRMAPPDGTPRTPTDLPQPREPRWSPMPYGNPVKALVCVIYPSPLVKDELPFTREQYYDIRRTIEGRNP